jgi:hypothetical protein
MFPGLTEASTPLVRTLWLLEVNDLQILRIGDTVPISFCCAAAVEYTPPPFLQQTSQGQR